MLHYCSLRAFRYRQETKPIATKSVKRRSAPQQGALRIEGLQQRGPAPGVDGEQPPLEPQHGAEVVREAGAALPEALGRQQQAGAF